MSHDFKYNLYIAFSSLFAIDSMIKFGFTMYLTIGESGENSAVLADLCSSGFDLFKANSHCILDSDEHIATLGVTYTTEKTMFSVAVAPDSPLKCACIYESDVSKEIPLTVQRYWISDTVVAKSTG